MAENSNIGSLNTKLILSTEGFDKPLEKSVAGAKRGAKQIDEALGPGGRSGGDPFAAGGKWASARPEYHGPTRWAAPGQKNMGGGASNKMAGSVFQNIGFGLDDFIQQTQAQGLQAGLRAVGNNLTAISAAFGPVAIVATAASVAFASKFLPALFDSAEAAKSAISDFGGLKVVLDSIAQTHEFRFRVSAIDSIETAADMIKKLRGEMEKFDKQEAAAQGSVAALRGREKEMKAPFIFGPAGAMFPGGGAAIGRFFELLQGSDEPEQRKRTAIDLLNSEKALAGIQNDRVSVQQQLNELKQQEADIAKRQEQTERKRREDATGSRLKSLADKQIEMLETPRDRLMDDIDDIGRAEARGLLPKGVDAKTLTDSMKSEFEKDLRAKGDRFRTAFETPSERVEREIREAQEALQNEQITQSEFDRFSRRSRNSLKGDSKSSPLLERGSVEQQSFINRTLRGDKDTQRDIEQNTKGTEKNTAQAVNAINNLNAALPKQPIKVIQF